VPTEPEPLTLSRAVRRAVEAVDPDGADDRLADFLTRFEDRDEPIRGLPNIDEEMAEATRALDVEEDDGALAIVGAIVTYLAFRRGEANADPERLIQLAVDAEFNGHPPPSVTAWLEQSA
jgi:hypothetical protein